MSFGVVIVGAGKGERLGMLQPKCLVRVDDIPLLLVSTWAFERVEQIAEIVLVVPAGYDDEVQSACKESKLERVKAVVSGDDRRQDSVFNGIVALSTDVENVLIHDGARPLLTVEIIERLLEALKDEPAAFAAVPVSDTIHIDREGSAVKGPERINLVAAQTPQGFSRDLLLDAFDRCKQRRLTFTDEVAMVREVIGVNARIVPGEIANIKITGPEDLRLYDSLLKERVRQMKGSLK